MGLIEGFRVQNYRALRNVTPGKLSSRQGGAPLTPFTVVIGKNGVGKSSLFDAFGFVAGAVRVGGLAAIKKAGWLLPGQIKHECHEARSRTRIQGLGTEGPGANKVAT